MANNEITISLLLLAIAVPMQAVSATYKGVNEAYLNFKSINILRVALGVANFGGPYLVSYFTHELHWLVATLVVSRTLALLVYRYCAYTCVSPGRSHSFSSSQATKLLKFGGWVTVSGVISPFLVQADRFSLAFDFRCGCYYLCYPLRDFCAGVNIGWSYYYCRFSYHCRTAST